MCAGGIGGRVNGEWENEEVRLGEAEKKMGIEREQGKRAGEKGREIKRGGERREKRGRSV